MSPRPRIGFVVLVDFILIPSKGRGAYTALEQLFNAIFTALWLSLYLFGGGIWSSLKKSLLVHGGWSEIWEIILLRSPSIYLGRSLPEVEKKGSQHYCDPASSSPPVPPSYCDISFDHQLVPSEESALHENDLSDSPHYSKLSIYQDQERSLKQLEHATQHCQYIMLQEATPGNAAAMEAAAWEAARKVVAAAARGAAARRAAAAWEAAAWKAAREAAREADAWEAAREAVTKEAAAWEAVREAEIKKAAAWKAVTKEAAVREASAAAWGAAWGADLKIFWETAAAREAAAAAREAAAAAREAAVAAREAAVSAREAAAAAGEAATAAGEAAREAAALETTFEALEQQELLFAIFTALWSSLYLFGGGIGSSSKKSLLAHDGWSEIWEIVLLKSGDVEKNPGPRRIADEELAKVSDRPIEEDDLSFVFDALLSVCAKWSRLCCCLGLGASLLDTIKKNHPGDAEQCLFEGLKQWVQRNYNTDKYGLPNWRNLVAAVDNSSGGHNHALALRIAKQHQESDPVQTSEENAAPSVIIPEKHKAIDGTTSRIQRRSQKMSRSSAFKSMYRSVVGLMRGVDVGEIKGSLRYLTDPHCPTKLCVPPRVYRSATTTKELLDRLCPRYVNPGDTFILEEIVNDFGSRRCKKELKDYTDHYV